MSTVAPSRRDRAMAQSYANTRYAIAPLPAPVQVRRSWLARMLGRA